MASMVSVDYTDMYQKCAERLREINALEGIQGQISWDEMTFMPPGAAATRGAQKSSLAGVVHEKRTTKELGDMLAILNDAPQGALSEVQKAVVRDEHKEFVKNIALPKDLVTRMAKLSSDANTAWVEARKASDFSMFAPFLQQWVDLNIEKAKYLDPTRKVYDVLLDDYEKGMTSARLDEIFDEVRTGLVPLIAELKKSDKGPDASWLQGEFDTDTQADMCREICLDLGFDVDRGRLDVSVHPFTGGSHPTDVRMTTRFKPDDITEGLTGAIHETGHAIYEQGRNLSPEWKDLAVSKALSMGVHESQSLLWERMVGLCPDFQNYLLPKMQKYFPGKFDGKTPEDLYLGINKVKERSAIRVESDEVTYTLHIILRYEIEKGLIDGSIKVEDVPAIWNQKMKEYLDVDVENDAEGCLQDVHWSMGALGYFPTYSLGAMNACQIFRFAQSRIPDLKSKIKAGDFDELRELLNEDVHKLGSLPTSGDELMEKVTGAKLNPQVFLEHLRSKYSRIYQL
jgi:carboxypeptidase Taq